MKSLAQLSIVGFFAIGALAQTTTSPAEPFFCAAVVEKVAKFSEESCPSTFSPCKAYICLTNDTVGNDTTTYAAFFWNPLRGAPCIECPKPTGTPSFPCAQIIYPGLTFSEESCPSTFNPCQAYICLIGPSVGNNSTYVNYYSEPLRGKQCIECPKPTGEVSTAYATVTTADYVPSQTSSPVVCIQTIWEGVKFSEESCPSAFNPCQAYICIVGSNLTYTNFYQEPLRGAPCIECPKPTGEVSTAYATVTTTGYVPSQTSSPNVTVATPLPQPTYSSGASALSWTGGAILGLVCVALGL